MFARASTRTSKSRRKLLNAVVIILPVSFGVGCYSVHRWASDLEARYPPLSPADAKAISTTLLRTPCNPATQRCAYVDIYSARVPLRSLLQGQQRQRQRQRRHARGGRVAAEKTNEDRKENLHITWAKAFLSSRIMAAEAPYFGLPIVTGGEDDDDRSIQFLSVPNGKDVTFEHGSLAFVTDQKKDKRGNPVEGVLFCWHMPDPPRKFFESIARWGYPWRLMSGGRHELSVSPAFIPKEDHNNGHGLDNEPMVELRFASAHDYEIVPAEGPLEKQKILPAWILRLHRAYARFVLDMVVKEMMEAAEKEL
jgi:hypothetical protein